MQRIASDQCRTSWAALYARYRASLTAFLIRMLHGDRKLAEDCLQEVFIKVFQRAELFKAQYPFKSWVYTIASNEAKMVYRSTKRSSDIDPDQLRQAADRDPNNYDQQHFTQLLEEALSDLDEGQREVFVLRYMEKMSLAEVVEITQIPLGTVKSRLFYASKKLALYLQEFDPREETELFKLK